MSNRLSLKDQPAVAVALAALLAIDLGAMVYLATRRSPQPQHRLVSGVTARSPADLMAEEQWQRTRSRWGAEADVLEMVLAERLEPQGSISCHRRAGRHECPVRLACGQPTRWAACRLRRPDEREDDGSRCAWIVEETRDH